MFDESPCTHPDDFIATSPDEEPGSCSLCDQVVDADVFWTYHRHVDCRCGFGWIEVGLPGTPRIETIRTRLT